MYLKSIEVHGFKSFANKITFEFQHGITGIVGPNGSGKSNVADAVRWVLGEQSAKQLRGSKMEDVIFAGTQNRKPLGYAYVAITLDNSDKSLPVDYEEVTVARRVYRSGESEYLLNGTPCRLKDVNALFFDTGIGKEGYSIIGQGQIDKILSGKPEERRELFDEAAGIVKYKKNKEATQKELMAQKANLERVNDILSELSRQVEPLRKQDEVARKYLVLRDQQKTLDINVYLLEQGKVKKDLEEMDQKLQYVDEQLKSEQQKFEATKEEYEILEKDLEDRQKELEEIKNQQFQQELLKKEGQGRINVLTEQMNAARIGEESFLERIGKIQGDIEKKETEKEEYLEKKALLDEQMDATDDGESMAQESVNQIQKQINQIESEIEKNKADMIECISKGSLVKEKVGRYDAMLENIQVKKVEINQRYLQYKSKEEQQNLLVAEFEGKLEKTRQSMRENQGKIQELSELQKTNAKELESVRHKKQNQSDKIQQTKAKLESLRNITERYDGYGNSIKRVMEQKKSKPGIHGVVADLITVKKEYEIAVETALGGSIQNIVTEDEGTAKDLIEFLKKNKFGRATFLPLANIKSNDVFKKTEALKEPGVIGIASELVESDVKYKDLIKQLLGRILVTDTIDHALAIGRKYQYSMRIVTLEGELLNPGGAMTGGAFKNTSNLLGRKRELEELETALEQSKMEWEATLKEEETLKKSLEEAQEKLKELQSIEQNLNLKQNTETMHLKNAKEQIQEIEKAYVSIKSESKELDIQVESIEKSKNELYDGNKVFEELQKNCEENTKTLNQKLVELKEEKEAALKKVQEVTLSIHSLKQQDDFLITNIRRLKKEQAELEEEVEKLKHSLEDRRKEKEEKELKLCEEKEQIEKIEVSLKEQEEWLKNKNIEKEEISKKHKAFFSVREKLSEEINRLDKEQFRLNDKKERMLQSQEEANRYMWEQYELTYNYALEFKNEAMQDLPAMKKELSSVKSQMKALGDVNVNAIEEYKNVSERYEFLSAQQSDILESQKNLNTIIEELDVVMRNQFSVKFKEIQDMFDKVFKELFGGGKSSLELVEEEDILEAGIRIIAQPPGKKLQNMMQLSGGEKALTAIALLFAIQSLKPSPFCLLDEIEAALDDSNVYRYANYLHKLTKDTQFIVITHRKGTMEAADSLYGITMQERGVSTLVSVNLIASELEEEEKV